MFSAVTNPSMSVYIALHSSEGLEQGTQLQVIDEVLAAKQGADAGNDHAASMLPHVVLADR